MTPLSLPWPPKELNPNSTAPLRAKMSAKKSYRELCWGLSLSRKGSVPDGPLRLILTFCPPDRRARDDDNMLASFKHGRDGLALALGINDGRFRTSFTVGDVVPGGAVLVEVEPA
ncbi:endodeoxyribonuclease RusA [Sphingomonas montanisoli]|uniref:Endodeoxyribonuclease RusA n=1 Tax=Sphingomonas montanisoli TaxID=2606412 RepID=A0A5D9C3Q3_9SPHN|nr:endodeoxyribonuclease RusA [Sphingomonas montanisoli]TZG25600.1 endodeoxyribonuclease RusA [Sphingomonas montanisoli]